MRISKEKQERIKEQILGILFQNSPKALFTSDIAKELVRDEEFTKRLLSELKDKGFVVSVTKNSRGIKYSKRIRWRISPKIYVAYKKLKEKGIEIY